MTTYDKSDPFGGDENHHALYQHLMDHIVTTFDKELPAHVEQAVMLFYVGEINRDWIADAMQTCNFSPKPNASNGLKMAINQWKTEQKELMNNVGIGEYWFK